MDDAAITLLLVEDNPGDVRLFREMLQEAGGAFQMAHVDRLDDALALTATQHFDVMLLDLSLPDAHGLTTVVRANEHAAQVPIIVLTGMNDEEMAIKAMQAGAQDYLIKGQLDANLLRRAIRYAIERHRLREALLNLSTIDDLTGLYNRRGFFCFIEQHLKLALRNRRPLLLIFADLDGLKEINDTYGHPEGDIALIRAAEILRDTFRESDIIARMGGDEFAIVVLETELSETEQFPVRLQQQLEFWNATHHLRYPIAISIGIADFDPECPSTVDQLLSRADAAMYSNKRHRRQHALL